MTKEYAKLTLYYIPSPLGINWENPTKLARSILANKLAMKKRFMGHVNIKLEYSDGEVAFFTGITGDTKSSPKLIFKEGFGLGVLYHSYDGSLEDAKDLDIELSKYFKIGNKRINFSRYIINLDTAQRLIDYLNEFKEKNLDRYYGLVNNPLHGEGSGCSAFGASFLRVAGLMDDEYKEHCSQNVTLPNNLCGAPLYGRKVNYLKMIFKKYDWSEHEGDYQLHFWDPDLMHRWVEKKLTAHNDKSDYKVVHIDNTSGIEFDHFHTPTPSEDIFRVKDVKSKKPDLKIKNNKHIYSE